MIYDILIQYKCIYYVKMIYPMPVCYICNIQSMFRLNVPSPHSHLTGCVLTKPKARAV